VASWRPSLAASCFRSSSRIPCCLPPGVGHRKARRLERGRLVKVVWPDEEPWESSASSCEAEFRSRARYFAFLLQ
jgi:hypothetical protein